MVAAASVLVPMTAARRAPTACSRVVRARVRRHVSPTSTSRVHLARPRASAPAARANVSASSGSGGDPGDGLGSTLTAWLLRQEQAGSIDADQAIVLSSIAVACKRIAAMVQREYYDADEDMGSRANDIFRDALRVCGRTGVVASGAGAEDAPFAVEESFAGDRVVVFDPLDGVSNVDAAVTTGSIFGVYAGDESCVPDFDADDAGAVEAKCVASACRPGKNLEAAGYCMYSASTILVLTLGDGAFGFTFDPAVGEFVMSHERIQVPERGKIYSFNEGNYDGWDDNVKAYVDALKNGGPDESGKPYSARYIGSLVADVHRTLLYGGVCGQPATRENPAGRLRLLTECAPMAFVAEQCGAKASTGSGRVLEAEPETVHQRTPFYLGSAKEIEYLEGVLAKHPATKSAAKQSPAQKVGGTKSSASDPSSGVGKDTLSTWLFKEEKEGHLDADLAVIINSIAVACKRISSLVATAPIAGLVGLADSKNKSGDEQKKLDVIANDIFCDAMANTARSAVIVTEEEDVPVGVDALSGDYVVCFDPIDGSSNIDAAVPTGSIWGVYHPGENCAINPEDDAEAALQKCVVNARKSGEELACAGYVLYSSSTVMMLTTGHGVYGFTLDWSTGEFVMSHEDVKIPETTATSGRYYSGNQGNVDKWAPEMKEYVEHLQKGGDDGGAPFVYRYIGALVGDFHRTLLYGGIWLYPPDKSAPEGKARLLYEVAPMGWMAEQAGGAATRGDAAKDRVVEVIPEHIHQRSPMFVGSKSMVEGLQKFLADR